MEITTLRGQESFLPQRAGWGGRFAGQSLRQEWGRGHLDSRTPAAHWKSGAMLLSVEVTGSAHQSMVSMGVGFFFYYCTILMPQN